MRASVLVVLVAAVLGGCIVSPCDNDVVSEVRSPDGRRIATVFERGCGATTQTATVVALRDADAAFDGEQQDDWVLVVADTVSVEMSWPTPDRLDVRHAPSDRVRLQQVRWNDVAVSIGNQ